jgi:DNA-binding NarL/FixJ family response regulator
VPDKSLSEDMRVIIGDDHALFRKGLQLQLQQMAPSVEVLNARNFAEVMHLAESEDNLDLLLLDLGMPGVDWRQAIDALHNQFPNLPIVVISADEKRSHILDALDHGAVGYIPKSSEGSVMLRALELVLAGGVYLPPEILAPRGAGSLESTSENGLALPQLTPRQTTVLSLLAAGQSNKEIARTLDLSEGTVKHHVAAVLKAFNAGSRAQAVLLAARFGLLSDLTGTT